MLEFNAPNFTIAARPHRRRNSTRQFTRCTTKTTKTVSGVDVIGVCCEWAVAGTAYGITYSESGWWLYGGHIDPVEVADPHDAIDVLRRRHLLKAAS
jgi:hypothetical protein